MTLHTTKKLQILQMAGNNITKKSLHEVVDKYIFFFDLTVFSPVKKSWKVESPLQYLNSPQKNCMKPNMLFIGFELGRWRWGRGWERKESSGVGGGGGVKRKKALRVITSCQFQFQKQIPPTCQQPSTNSHCQNEHLSKVVSFGKGFYDTNKTLKLLTVDECGLKKKSSQYTAIWTAILIQENSKPKRRQKRIIWANIESKSNPQDKTGQ